MLTKFFKKNKDKDKEKNLNKKNILIIALLVHAAKIDENYTDAEREIIKKTIVSLNSVDIEKAEDLLKFAEEKEKESNQIVEFTKEIKKYSTEFRLKIVEIVWKILYSDGSIGEYESNLMRRICGLLYVTDKDSGVIKMNIKNSLK